MHSQGFISIIHNLEPQRFMWLWMKYVTGVNDGRHCTNCLRGKYGKLLSKHNQALMEMPELVLDEQPIESYSRIYICGVIKKGYPKSNYLHNVHAAIRLQIGASDLFEFENWTLKINNGILEAIPSELELPKQYRSLPRDYTSCRIFRWAVCSRLNASRVADPTEGKASPSV